MDEDGYPDEEELKTIREWDFKDFYGLLEFVKPIWKYSDMGYFDKGSDKRWHLSTGGWSGNEDIISAMMDNAMFWNCHWWSSRRGGHYIFNKMLMEEDGE